MGKRRRSVCTGDNEVQQYSRGKSGKSSSAISTFHGRHEEQQTEEWESPNFELYTKTYSLRRAHLKVFWQVLQLLALTINLVFLPLDVFLNRNHSLSLVPDKHVVLYIIADVLNMLDTLYRFKIFSICDRKNRQKYMYSSAVKWRLKRDKQYVSGKGSKTDLLTIIPLDFFAYLAGVEWSLLLRLVKILRVQWLREILRFIGSCFEYKRVMVNAGFQRTVALWYIFSLLAHWFGCAFYFLGVVRVESGALHSWVLEDGLLEYNTETMKYETSTTITHAYFRALYWAIVTMVTVGLGDIVPAGQSEIETLFTVFAMYVGVLITCVLVGNLTNLVANLDAAEDEFHVKVDNLNKYMSYRHLSSDLQQRIRAYYWYMWKSLKGIDEDGFLNELPSSLRTQVAGLRSKDLITQVSFIRGSTDTLVNALCFALEQIVVSPGDMVVRKGNTIQGAHFLARGEAEQLGPGDSVVAQLSGKFGSYFGDISFFFPGTNHNHSVKAKSYCEFFFLPRDEFCKVIKAHCDPAEIKKMEAAAEKAAKRDEKVQKFFGLDSNTSNDTSWWANAVLPNSRFRMIWSFVSLVGVVYNVFIIPLRLTAYFDGNISVSEYIVDWVFDAFFIANVILNARYFAFMQEGIVIRDASKVFEHYRKSSLFVVHMIAVFPLDILGAIDTTQLPLIRITKALFSVNFGDYYNLFVKVLASKGVTFTNSFHRLIKIFFLVIVFVHWIGCGWLLMAYYTYSNSIEQCELLGLSTMEEQCTGESPCRNDWLCMDHTDTLKYIDHREAGVSYLRAVYFVLVDMTTVGYGDIIPLNTPETVYAAVITLFGGFLYPAVVGAMAALIGNLNVAKANFKQKVSTLNKYMDIKEFPLDLRRRIHRYYDYLWSRQRGVDEDVILNDLPPPLRMEVQQAINGSIIDNISFLHSAGPDFIKHILSILKPAVFLPNDLIIRAGEYGQEMYLLERGAVRVTSPDGGTVYAVLSRGDYFGEGCLLKAEKRTAAIRAIGYCDCFVLHRQGFQKLLHEFPEAKEKIMSSLSKTIEKKKLQNAKVSKNFQDYQKLNNLIASGTETKSIIPGSSFRHPESHKRVIWSSVVFVAIIYYATVIPLRLTFQPEPYSFIADYLFDVLFLVDVALNIKYFGYASEGVVNHDKDDIVHHYKHKSGRRWIDLIASIPCDIIALFVLGSPHTVRIMAILRIPKLVRILQIPSYSDDLDKLLNNLIQLPNAMAKLLKLLFGVLIVSHYTACGFHMMAVYGHATAPPEHIDCESPINAILFQYLDSCPLSTLLTDDVDLRKKSCGATGELACTWYGTWVQLQARIGLLPVDGGNPWEQYLRALNWAIPTLVVVVIGDVIPVNHYDTLYVTIGIIVGVTINAAIIGNIANLVANLEGHGAQFRAKVDALEKFLHHYQIPKQQRERTRNFYQYVWETQKGYNQENIVNDLPATLRYEVSSVHKLCFVAACPFFEFCDPAMLKTVAYSLTREVFSPGDYIINEGEFGSEMFFIERGNVQFVLMDDNYRHAAKRRATTRVNPSPVGTQTVVATASNGEFFGESALFFATRRMCSVQAVGYCEVYVLSKQNLDDILMRFPFERERMFNEVSKLQKSNKKRNAAVRKHLDVADPSYANNNNTHSFQSVTNSFKTRAFRTIQRSLETLRISSGNNSVGSTTVFPTQAKIAKFQLNRTHVFEHDEYAPNSNMLHPNRKFVRTWRVIALALECYMLVSIPFSISFFVAGHGDFRENFPPLVIGYCIVEMLVDMFFIMDCWMRAKRIGVTVHGTLSFDETVIWEEYKKHWLKLDVVANLPLEILAFIPVGTSTALTRFLFLRFHHLIRITHVPSLLLKIDSMIQDSHVRITSAWQQVIRMFVTFFLVNHFYACVWFFIHRFLETTDHNTWAIVDGLATYSNEEHIHNVVNEDVSVLKCYLRAFYFTVTTLSTVGYGDIRPYTVLETLFQLWVVLTGACLFAGIIGSVAVALFHDDANGSVAFSAKMRKLKEYMTFRELPLNLQEQIQEYYGKMWVEQRGVNTKEILSELPIPMQLDIAYATHHTMLLQFPLISLCNKHVRKQLALSLNSLFVSANNNVYSKGDIGHEVFFVIKGELEHINEEKEVMKYHEGDFFGNETFFSVTGERKEQVVAKTDCKLFYIEKDDFEAILVDFPQHRGVGIFKALYGDCDQSSTAGSLKLRPRRTTALDTFAEIFQSDHSQHNLRQSPKHQLTKKMGSIRVLTRAERKPKLESKLERSRSVGYLLGLVKAFSTDESLAKFQRDLAGSTHKYTKVDDSIWHPEKEQEDCDDTKSSDTDESLSTEDSVSHIQERPRAPAFGALGKSKSTRAIVFNRTSSRALIAKNRKVTIDRKQSFMQRAFGSLVRVVPDDDLERELQRKTLLPDSLKPFN